MRLRDIVACGALCAGLTAPAVAQQDSAKRVADSLALVKELEGAAARPAPAPAAQAPGRGGPTNPRMLPDISAVGDMVGDLSRRGSTQPGGQRFAIREVEVAIQAPVDPYFRGDVFLGISDEEGVSIEQAFLTATALPWGLEGRIGRFLMPFGKQNTTHRHDLHTIEYPYVIQKFLSQDGLKGTGLYVSKVFSPFGFYQELQLTAVDRFGEANADLTTADPINRQIGNLGYSARLRNYFDLTNQTNLELSASAITGKRAQPTTGLAVGNAVAARQSVVGVDLTYRWRPLQQGLYRSFIFQAEAMKQLNEKLTIPNYGGPTRDYSGAYAFARYQLSRRTFIGARYDWVQDPEAAGDKFSAGSGVIEFFPSEFSKLVVGYERVTPPGESAYGRILLQATFAVGPHKPHPF